MAWATTWPLVERLTAANDTQRPREAAENSLKKLGK